MNNKLIIYILVILVLYFVLFINLCFNKNGINIRNAITDFIINIVIFVYSLLTYIYFFKDFTLNNDKNLDNIEILYNIVMHYNKNFFLDVIFMCLNIMILIYSFNYKLNKFSKLIIILLIIISNISILKYYFTGEY